MINKFGYYIPSCVEIVKAVSKLRGYRNRECVYNMYYGEFRYYEHENPQIRAVLKPWEIRVPSVCGKGWEPENMTPAAIRNEILRKAECL